LLEVRKINLQDTDPKKKEKKEEEEAIILHAPKMTSSCATYQMSNVTMTCFPLGPLSQNARNINRNNNNNNKKSN
jgi:hypothetical protein